MTTYAVVVAFFLDSAADLHPDALRDELAVLFESQYDVARLVDVAIREVKPRTGKPGPSKLTSGQWGSNGL